MQASRESTVVLGIDVGATYIKRAIVNDRDELVTAVDRVLTPYPCSPDRLVSEVVDQIRMADCARVGVGFPGEFHDGVVVEPGNLSRSGGILTDIDPALHASWMGFPLQAALRRESGADVRVVNDAALAALGCAVGEGRELVFTLGTAFGIALVVDGSLERIRDVGAVLFLDGRTYDQTLGEPSRAQDEGRWATWLRRAVEEFVSEFFAETVHFGGGNARRVDLNSFDDIPAHFVLNDNNASLLGAAKLFRD